MEPTGVEYLGAGEPDSDQAYLGVVKSYNDRRGFGFIACPETAAAFGRDVYMAKIEAQIAAADCNEAIEAIRQANEQPSKLKGLEGGNSEKQPALPRLAEEDIVCFKVRLSIEGFPQAVQVQRLRKYRGLVMTTPSPTGWEGELAGRGTPGVVSSRELAAQFHGFQEAWIRQPGCGQVRLIPGDEVTFCVPEELNPHSIPGSAKEAMMVMLSSSNRPPGSVLGCCILVLPRPSIGEGKHQLQPLRLDCHAFGAKVILSGLQQDVSEAELMRFFSKHGAVSSIVAHAKGCSFASITFQSMEDVARLLGRTAHAFADDKETRICSLHTHNFLPGGESIHVPRLPALPAPSLTAGEEPGSLLVIWSPLILAAGYAVEIRPVGVPQATWSAVDVAAGRPGSERGRFDADCSSCKVAGLLPGSVYEARVTYFASCGCRSEASDASPPCTPCGAMGVAAAAAAACSAAAAVSAACGVVPSLVAANAASTSGLAGGAWPNPLLQQAASATTAPAWSAGVPGVQAALSQLTAPQLPAVALPGLRNNLQGDNPWAQTLSSALPTPGHWRCAAHGNIMPIAPQPELQPADDGGFAVSVRWASTAHATGYVIELREAQSLTPERFYRPATGVPPGSPIELRVGGLRPGGGPGRSYVACIRCIGTCGCESASSAPGWSPPLGACPPTTNSTLTQSPPGTAASSPGGMQHGMELQQQPPSWTVPPPTGPPPAIGSAENPAEVSSIADTAPPPCWTPPLPAAPATQSPPCTVASSPTALQASTEQLSFQPLPSWTVPPPTAPPPAITAAGGRKEPPPEVTGQEHCLVLD